MKKQYVIYPILMLFVSILFIFLTSWKDETMQSAENFDAFDTYSMISVVSSEDKSVVLSLCNDYLNKMDEIWSPDNPKSEISALNNYAGESYVPLSPETMDILEKSQAESEKTKGYFDITTGAIINLWGIGNDPKVPSGAEIADAISKTGTDFLKIDKGSSSAMLTKKGVSVNLGAIAKGYATKEIVEILKNNNISSALVNLGGNTYALGSVKGKPWRIGIQDPKRPDDLICTLSLCDTSVITSGNYIRYFEKDGVRYHHIMNPFTGRPSESGLLSVTIINPDPMIADVLSTACFVMGYNEDSLSVLKDTNSQAVFVTEDDFVFYSEDLTLNFKPDNKTYKYIAF